MALLKLESDRTQRNSMVCFHGLTTVALLKPIIVFPQHPTSLTFPRSYDRGFIEALYDLFSRFFPLPCFHGLTTVALLKLLFQLKNGSQVIGFHGLMTVALLKC